MRIGKGTVGCPHLYDDPKMFWEKTREFLLKREAEYNLLISIIERIIRLPDFYKDFYLLAMLDEQGEVQGAAWMTPPHPLGLTHVPNESIEGLVHAVYSFRHAPTGLVGPVEPVEAFKKAWVEKSNASILSTMRQGLYELRQVIPPSPVQGSMRIAREEDRPLMEEWAYQFAVDCNLPADRNLLNKAVDRGLLEKSRYFWEVDGSIVSMAGASGQTPHGVRIGWVYTPPELRGKGYATVLVAGVSQALLDAGKTFCFLYTDMDNPVSNAIYQRIGYRFVASSLEYKFNE